MMSVKWIVGVFAVTFFGACADDGLADRVARDQARNAINPVLADQFPGVPLEPATNCVINEASASEIFRLAKAGTVGLEPEDTQLVIEIATRPDTVQCLVRDGLAPFIAQGLI
ncbi:MAG: succinate dehydrogenase [Litoreibacter sp.]